jgi:elongation factor G
MFAAVTFDVTPGGSQGSADEPTVTLADTVRQSVTADEYVALVEGLQSSFSRGPLGFPVSGVNITVQSVEKDPDTVPGAVRACVSTFVDALLRGPHKALLEPIMTVEVDLPSVFLGDVLSDITVKRRGQVKEVVNRDMNSTIIADVPLATMLGYATVIRSMTQGEGAFSMEYVEHAPVDAAIVNEFLQS